MSTLVDHIEVRYRPSLSQGVFQYLKVPPSQGTVLIPGVERNMSYDVEARSVSARGTPSNWVPVTHVVAAASLPLAVPVSFAVTSLADGVHAAWASGDTIERADTEFEVWRAPDASGVPGAFALLTVIRGIAFTDPTTDGVLRWYQVREKDQQGVYSAFTGAVSSAGKNVSAAVSTAQTTANNAQGTANAADPAKIVNPNFTQVLTGWTPDAANEGWYGETGANSPAPLLTTYAVHAGSTVNPPNTTATATTALRNNAFAPITTGEVFTAAVQIKPVSTPDGYANARISWRNASQAEISVSQGNSITNATGTGTSRVSATAPAGAVYAHAEVAAYNHTVGYYSFTAASWSYQPTNQSEVPNGGGHNSVTAIDPNGLALIDFTQVGHVSKNLDNIGDGPTYGRMYGTDLTGSRLDFSKGLLNKQLDYIPDGATYVRSMQQVASGAAWIIDNALFQQWDNGANTTVPGWIAQSGCAVSANSAQKTYGTYCLDLVTTSGGANYARSSKNFLVKPGDLISLTGLVNAVNGAGTFMSVTYGNAGGLILSLTTSTVTAAAWTAVSANGVVPSNASYAFITLNGAGGGAYHSLFQFVQVTVNDIRVAGSGAQVGDQRNLPPILTAGAQAVWQNLTISATTAAGTPATATISVSAAQIIGALASSGLVSYNASSAGTTGTGGTQYTYYLYYLDKTLAGGTLTLQVTTTPNDLRAQLGVVYIGLITFTYPTSGTGTGGGVSGLCVCDGMFIDDETTAIEARPGHLFDCIDIPTQGMSKFRRRLQSVDYGTVPCVRITTDAGAVLECSTTTPFDVLDGRTVLAPMMLGEQVVTDEGIQTVARVDDIGEQHVCHIHLGGVSYAAGADPEHRIYSHNVKP